jgi:hypothetical protein
MHHVHTGVVLLVPHASRPGAPPPGPGDSLDEGWLVRSFACTTEVVFDDLPLPTIEAYVQSGGRAWTQGEGAATTRGCRAAPAHGLPLPGEPLA